MMYVCIYVFYSITDSIFFLAIFLFLVLKLIRFSFVLLYIVSVLKSSSSSFILIIFSFSIALSFLFVDSIIISVSDSSILVISSIASSRFSSSFIVFIILGFLISLGLYNFIKCKKNVFFILLTCLMSSRLKNIKG